MYGYPRLHRGSTRERVGLRNEIEAKGKGDGVERVAGPSSSSSSSSLRRETKLRRRVPRLNVTVSVEEGLLPFEEDRIERYGKHLCIPLIDAISTRIPDVFSNEYRGSGLKIGASWGGKDISQLSFQHFWEFLWNSRERERENNEGGLFESINKR